jgi:thioredoxin reductase
VALGAVPNTRLAGELGCELDGDGYIVTDERQATTVPFVYAAGDCDGGHKQVTQAMAEGELAAIELAKRLRATGVPPPARREAG